ncbi:MAG: DUF1800 domain-containing protein, partial [Armatimonadota bacterium]|nr:DUF1800 domain-containing protein [Armatimonadota bacterium]
GVDGGYTQQDVQEVARCLTGWGMDRENGTFRFYPFLHDNGEKTVLGQKIPAGGGIRDGEMVLDILASHPSTARYIAGKLCVRFVADEPPAALVDRIAKTFLDTKGDLKAVLNAIVYSPEFFSSAAYRAKIKSPFEFAVSAVRALGGSIEVPDPAVNLGRLSLVVAGGTSLQQGGNKGMRILQGRKSLPQQIALMGQPLFGHQAPDGYPENSQEWVSSGALIARLNFALDLTGGQVADVSAPLTTLLEGVSGDNHEAVLDRLNAVLLGGDMSPGTRAIVKNEMPAPGTPPNPAKLSALILGSPEFQRR